MLIACLDVDYRSQGAVAAGVWFRGWGSAAAEFESAVSLSEVAEYEPGSFYRRELPCMLAVLKTGPQADVVVVDGYVWLADRAAGLGAHLHAVTGGVVVGVAKSRFAGATSAVPVCRGRSRSPLYVTAVGMSVTEAAESVTGMHGPYRVPTLLRRVDALTRYSSPAAEPNAATGRANGDLIGQDSTSPQLSRPLSLGVR
jgi:deoxyribonuclease V